MGRTVVIGDQALEVIGPPLATGPQQLGRLIADALGDGDLPAALSYYQPDALVAGSGRAVTAGHRQLERMLARLVDARLAVDVRVVRLWTTGSVALLHATWTARGSDADGVDVTRHGRASAVICRGTDDGWRVAVQELRVHA